MDKAIEPGRYYFLGRPITLNIEKGYFQKATEPLWRRKVYIVGSLRNPQVPVIAEQIRAANYTVFDDWYAAGPEADDRWRDYEKARGHNFREALAGHAARNVFDFDRRHIDAADVVVLVLPAGKSGHLELGYALGKGKPGYILLESADPERFDVMYNFATGVFGSVEDLLKEMENERRQQSAAK